MFLLYFVGDLVAEEDEVGSALDHVGYQMLVLRFQLLGVLEDVLGVLMGHLFSVVARVCDLNIVDYIKDIARGTTDSWVNTDMCTLHTDPKISITEA